MKRSNTPPIGLSLLIAIVYFAGAELGLSLASVHENITPVWPPTGIAIASLLIFGVRVWPGIFVGALAANLLTSAPVASTFGIAIGNTLEAVVAWSLLQRSKGWRKSFDTVGDVLTFVVYAAVLAPLVSATIGSLSVCFGDPAGGAVDVYLERHGSLAEIRIEDTGPGVPPEFLPRIFERFSQADGSSTRKHGGLGLGLAIVRHLVELHGGTVSAANRDAGGAVLSVRLPIMH